ncbi:MAG: gliding motility lipoprotein GldH [Bacteroidota bacterium]
MKTFPLSLFVLFILVSCQKGVAYKEFHKFDHYVWERFDKVKFVVPVEEAGMKADIVFTIRHITQYPYDNLPVNVILTTPSGEARYMERDIRLKNEKGEFSGSVAGDLWDFEVTLWPGFQFNDAGNYTIEFENRIPKMGIPGLVDIGVYLKKSK